MRAGEFFEGRIKLQIEGLNLNKLVRRLSAATDIYNFSYLAPHTICFEIPHKARKTVFAICEEMCYNISVVGRRGLLHLLLCARSRLALAVGMIVLVSLCAVFNSFIWTVQIEGNDRVLKSDIMKSVEQAGIKQGMPKSRLNVKELSNYLTASFEDISLVYVKTKGTLLKIDVVETLYRDQEIDRTALTPLVAGREGRVDKLLVYQGTPLVSVGDYVKQGQQLIGAYEDRLLPDGVTTERLFMKALGEAEMTVFYSHELTFAERQEQYVRTGKSKNKSSLSILGFSFFARGKNTYQHYESVTSTKTLFDRCLLPVKKSITTYFELEKREVVREFSAQESALKAQAIFEARLLLPEGAEITEEYCDVSGSDGNYRITGTVAVKTVVRP